MPNYANSKIYSIRFINDNKLIYIGSTVQPLTIRFSGHRKHFSCSLYQFIKENYNNDWNCCYIELIENFKCYNKEELNKKEGEMIRQFKADENYKVINKRIEGRTKTEYRLDNKDKITEQRKQYYIDNKDKITERKKQYYNKNKIYERSAYVV